MVYGITQEALVKQHQQKCPGWKEHSLQKENMYGYVARKFREGSRTDTKYSLSWTQDHYITSQYEDYALAIEGQETSTKYLVNKRGSDTHVIPKSQLYV